MSALEIKQLRKIYSNGVEALKGIDLCVETGDFFALLGVNGAGKSTTIGVITTLLTKTSGTVNICGYDLDLDPYSARASIGLVPQELNLNVFENCEQILLNQAGFYGITRKQARPRLEFLLDKLGLVSKRNVIARHLSGGMKRRLMLARALMHDPKILILDEPTAGMDIEIRRSMQSFLNYLNTQGVTIILTTHYLEEAELLCKNVAIIDQGVIVKHTSMYQLLKALRYQTFIFTTENAISIMPDLIPFVVKVIDEYTFELRVDKHVSLNEVFVVFAQHNLQISSICNKTSRLEELFLDTISHDR